MALSLLMLFVELALIRWLGENVVFLSFFTNFVLLGSFLGIGIGFLHARRESRFSWLPLSLFAIVSFVLLFPVQVSRAGSDVVFFGAVEVSGLPIWIMLPATFLGAAWILYLIAQAVAQTFVKFEPLDAYRLDILGSILGILAFSALAWARMPPVVWGSIAVVLIWWLGRSEITGRGRIFLVGILLMLGIQTLTPGYQWSPYYRVAAAPYDSGVLVTVNGIPHQTITSAAVRREAEPIYSLPYELVSGNLDRVLIVGAGTGTDVALALAAGARHVDAVEIDPTIYELGVDQNPDRPYADPSVQVVIDDGRAFMQRTDSEYDLIVFALPDSLTLVAGQSSLRLESFLFTQEAIDQAVSLLSDDGVFTMYNYYTVDWLIGRLSRTLSTASGKPTCVVAPEGAVGLALIATGRDLAARCPGSLSTDDAAAVKPTTDDRPFLYVREPGIPRFYLVGLASILATALLVGRWAGLRRGTLRENSDLFLMGVAFLLLETKSVVQFALWFGTTWAVNALVFAGVLLAVLAAVEVARRIALPNPAVVYGALIVSIALSWSIPPSALLELGRPLRLIAAVLLSLTPIFLANLVFAQRFKETSDSTAAFGANLLGAMVGGVLEYSALVVGYRALAILVGVTYLMAFVAWRWNTPMRSLAIPDIGVSA